MISAKNIMWLYDGPVPLIYFFPTSIRSNHSPFSIIGQIYFYVLKILWIFLKNINISNTQQFAKTYQNKHLELADTKSKVKKKVNFDDACYYAHDCLFLQQSKLLNQVNQIQQSDLNLQPECLVKRPSWVFRKKKKKNILFLQYSC